MFNPSKIKNLTSYFKTFAFLSFLWFATELSYGLYNLYFLEQIQTPSTLTFGYDQMRSGRAFSLIDPKENLSLKKVNFKSGSKADRFMPLYINGNETTAAIFKNRRVLIMTSGKLLTAIDIDQDRPLWSIQLPSEINSSPTIDMPTKSIYARGIYRDGANSFKHEVYHVDFNGNHKGTTKIDLHELYGAPTERIHCRTATGINKVAHNPYLFFGCSIATQTKKNNQYGSKKGVRGAIITAPLNPDGSLSKLQNPKIFKTSQASHHPMSGFDTGVYNLGAGPSVLEDGSLLVATGNGPTFLEQNNYGCSVVRLDGNSLQPMLDDQQNPMAFSRNEINFNECWVQNIEYSSSSVATVSKDQQYFSAVTSKDGFLNVFNPDSMAQHGQLTRTQTRIGRLASYGQPLIHLNSKNHPQVFTVAQSTGEFLEESYALMPKNKKTKHLINKSNSSCFGHISSEPTKDTKDFYLLYSGHIRNKYLNLVDPTLVNEITSFQSNIFGEPTNRLAKKGMWAPYKILNKQGHVYSTPSVSKNGKKYKLEPLDLSNSLIDNDMQEDYYYLPHKSKSLNCPNIDSSWLSLYRVRFEQSSTLKRGLHVHGFQVNDQYETELISHYYNPNFTTLNNHPALIENVKTQDPAIVFTAINKKEVAENPSLFIVDGLSGELISKVEIKGHPHYSMPLILDNLIIIPTIDEGLQVFKAITKYNIGYFWRKSLTKSLVKTVLE